MLKVAWLTIALALAQGCVESRDPKVANIGHPTLEGTHWILDAVQDRPANREGRAAYVELHAASLRFSGSTGLNAISGTYLLNGRHGLRFSLGLSTQIAGDDLAAEQERDFLGVLSAVNGYRLDRRELRLMVDDQIAALFVAE